MPPLGLLLLQSPTIRASSLFVCKPAPLNTYAENRIRKRFSSKIARISPCTSAMFRSTFIVALLIVSVTCAEEHVTKEPVEDQEAVESKRSTHSQKLEQGRTRGEYRIFLPDNRWQIVSYVADDDGYRATVRYENGPHDILRAEQTHWGFSTGTTASFANDETPRIDPLVYNPVNPPRIPHRFNPHSSEDHHYGKPRYQPQLRPPNRPPYPGVLTSQVNTFIVHPTPAERPDDGRKQDEHQPHFEGVQQTPPQLSKDAASSSPSSPPPVYIPRPYATNQPKPTTPPPVYTAPRPEKFPETPVYIPKAKPPKIDIKDSIIYDPNEYHPFFQPIEKPKILTVQPIRPFHLPDQFYENRFNQQQSVVTNLERPVPPTHVRPQQNQQEPSQHRPPVPQKEDEERPQQQTKRPYLDKPVSNEWTPLYQPYEQKPNTEEFVPSYPAKPTEPYVPKERLPFKASPPYPIEPNVEQQRPYERPAVNPDSPAQSSRPQQRTPSELAPSYPDKPIEPKPLYPVELYKPQEKPTVKPLPSYSEKPAETYEAENKPEYGTLPPYPVEPTQPYQPEEKPVYEPEPSYPDKPRAPYGPKKKPEYEPTVPYDEKPYESVTAHPDKPYEPVAAYPEKQDTPYEPKTEYERPDKQEYERPGKPEYKPASSYGEKPYEPVTDYPDKEDTPYEPQAEYERPFKPEYERPEKPEYERPGKPKYERPQKPEYERPENAEYERPEKPKYERPEKPKYERPEKPEYERPENAEYEQPEKPKYERPQKPEYERPENAEYERPQKPEYERPQNAEYERPEKPKYERPEKPEYERPEKPKYERPENAEYERPEEPTYERPEEPEYERPRKPEYKPVRPYGEKPYEPVTAYPEKPSEPVAAYPDKQDTPYKFQPEYERPEKPEYEPAPPYVDQSYEPVTTYPDNPYEPQAETAPPYVANDYKAVSSYPDRPVETYEPENKPEHVTEPLYPDYPAQQSPPEEYLPQYQTDRPFINQQTDEIRHPYRPYPPRPLPSIRPTYNRPPVNYRRPSRPYGVPHTGYPPGTPISGVTSIRPILNPKNQSLLTVDLDYSLEGEAPTEPPEFEPEEFVIPSTSTKKPEPPRKVYQPIFRKPFRDSPVRPKITRPSNNRVPVEVTEKPSNNEDSPLLAKYKFKGSSKSNDGYGQRTQPRRKQSSKQTSDFAIIASPVEDAGLSESIGYNSQSVENDNSYSITANPDEDQISELDSFLPIEEDFYSSNSSDSDVLYFDDGMIPPLLLRVRDKVSTAKVAEDVPYVTESLAEIATTTATTTQVPYVTPTVIPSTTIAPTTTTTKTTTSTVTPSTKAGKRKKKKRVRTKALKRGNGTGTIVPASKKVQSVSVIVKDEIVPTANVTLPRTSPRIRFPPRVRFVQKTAERVTRQNEKDADLLASDSANEAVVSRDFTESDMIGNHAMTKEDLMEWSLNAIPIERLDLVYDSIELEDKPEE
ncbi:adhesive plaque matrix protein [Daphnia magna]|uniref:adhesive plaque matrix protein n=1 Tax=Daphnia magna TaxID=35525 RepID=UPI001E1BC6C1|nr:adhesive plaque matrix protein [Daphnia magna]